MIVLKYKFTALIYAVKVVCCFYEELQDAIHLNISKVLHCPRVVNYTD